MSVYTKLNEARAKFHSLQLKKSGHNKFAGYSYFELGDFLIPGLQVFKEHGLCSVVTFTADTASMRIIDTETSEEVVITSPMGSAALKGCHEVQNIGAVETYQRRYLWVAALEIVEHDAVDAETGSDKPSAEPSKPNLKITPTGGAWEGLDEATQIKLADLASKCIKFVAMGNAADAVFALDEAKLDADHKVALWSRMDSKTRSAIKRVTEERKAA
jgi:hypothetical protein